MEARARRALAAVGLAAVVVVAIGVYYLRPRLAFVPVSRPAPRPALPLPPSSVQQLDFVSGTLGWVVTGRPNSASLYRTTDSGRHWQHQLGGVGGPGWRLSFFDARRGVVTGTDQRGPATWRTTDGGLHWTRSYLPCQQLPGLVSFVDADHGWCLAIGVSFGGAGGPLPDRQDLALYRTADGGLHWTQVLTTDQTRPVVSGLGDDGQKAWIWFRDARTGWIGEHSSAGIAVVYSTTDGGDHWNRQQLPPPAGGFGTAPLLVEEGPEAVGGRSSPWVVVTALTAGSERGQFLMRGRYLYALQSGTWAQPVLVPAPGALFVGQARWMLANGNSLLETTDAGGSWLALGQVPVGWEVGLLTMVDADHGWAVLFTPSRAGLGPDAPSGLARTADGGRRWTLVTVPP